MRLPILQRPWTAISTLLLASLPTTLAADGRIIESESLSTCQSNSGLTAQLFNVAFTPGNDTIYLKVTGVSTINGHVVAELDVTAYGYSIVQKKNLNPCSPDIDLSGLCPMTSGQIDIRASVTLPSTTVDQIPNIAYSIPDLDGQVQIKLYDYDQDTGVVGAQVACVQADLSNGKTVYQKGVGWSSAIIAGLALLTSAIAAGLGHSNTATHVAANAMSLFSFFQAQAIFGMTAVSLPPIVQSWTQNFQWSMGIIKADFIQDIANWYLQATGGSPSQILTNIRTTSVDVQKRSLDAVTNVASRGLGGLIKRQTSSASADQSTNQGGSVTVRGIERVGYRAGIEPTNIFMTAYIFFVVFIFFVCIGVIAFRFLLEGLAKASKMKSDKFQDFRNGWTTVLRGILFRIILIGFPQMTILCFWELVHQDSAGEEALAVVTIVTMIIMLAWACGKVWRLAKRSISMHKNPAYILYSDPVCLHKWGFLYVQYKATAYWFIMPLLAFILVIGLFVGLGQSSGTAQAIGILILNAGFLVAAAILRPYMDKKTNGFNIAIAAVNTISSIFLLFFTNIFGLPGLVVGIMGVIFFILNAAFALILLIMVLVATMYAIFSKNPDVRYQPMRDDRGSFIKSQSQLTTELDALGATARGEGKNPYKREIDEDSHDSGSIDDRNSYAYTAVQSPYNNTSQRSNSPFLNQNSQKSNSPYLNSSSQRSNQTCDGAYRGGSTHSSTHQPPPRVASPWQRGAGYDR